MRLHPFLLVVLGCRSTSAPPYRLESNEASIRASSVAECTRIARIVDELAPRARDLLRVSGSGRRPTLHLLTGSFPGQPVTVAGETIGTVIKVTRLDPLDERYTVAHELVHFYATGIWERLTRAQEEGLADFLACQLVPEYRDRREKLLAGWLMKAPSMDPEWALDRSWESWTQLMADGLEDPVNAYGYAIMRRCGVDELQTLCARAESIGLREVPAAWIVARIRDLPPESPSGLPTGDCLHLTFRGPDGAVTGTTACTVPGSFDVPPGTVSGFHKVDVTPSWIIQRAGELSPHLQREAAGSLPRDRRLSIAFQGSDGTVIAQEACPVPGSFRVLSGTVSGVVQVTECHPDDAAAETAIDASNGIERVTESTPPPVRSTR
jgi:hypothetical protein